MIKHSKMVFGHVHYCSQPAYLGHGVFRLRFPRLLSSGWQTFKDHNLQLM
jgi:hypothetical protein